MHCVTVSKRLWDLARANVTDFRSALSGSSDASPDVDVDYDDADGPTPGARLGQTARVARDRAEDAWDRAFRAAQERAARGAQSAGYTPSKATPAQLRQQWYRTLELPEGASLAEVRRSYRKMVAKYHPDRFASDPEKYAAATEVARKITEAYDGLREYLER